MNQTSSYVPGVCNINSAEVAYRRRAGYIMLAISAAIIAILLYAGKVFNLPNIVRLLAFLPLFVTAVCFLQVKYRFCVNYGANGKQNAAEGDKIAQDIVDKAARQLDLKRTRTIKLQAAAIAALATIILVAIPFQ